MKSEHLLLKELELQIAKIEKLVCDMQQDLIWQRIFYRKKLYFSLNSVFNKTYTEYDRYLENIINDYKVLKSSKEINIKRYYIERIQQKIFALLKVLRNLKKSTHQNESLYEILISKQHQVSNLQQQRQTLLSMLSHIKKQYDLFNQKLLFGKELHNQQQRDDLNKKLLQLLSKQGDLEKQLFSITERVNLLS